MINCLPCEQQDLKEAGLYIRIRTDRRNLRSQFADKNGGTLRGLFSEEKTQVQGAKDLFLKVDELEYSTPEARALLAAKLNQLKLSADSSKIEEAINTFFDKAKELKRQAANNSDSLSISEAAVLQNEINSYAVRFNCATISLIRIETDESKKSNLKQVKGEQRWKREERFVKVYFPEEITLDLQYLTDLLDGLTGIVPESEVRFVFGTKTVTSNGKKEVLTTIRRETSSNVNEIKAEQSARSTLDVGTFVGHQKQAPVNPIGSINPLKSIFETVRATSGVPKDADSTSS